MIDNHFLSSYQIKLAKFFSDSWLKAYLDVFVCVQALPRLSMHLALLQPEARLRVAVPGHLRLALMK